MPPTTAPRLSGRGLAAVVLAMAAAILAGCTPEPQPGPDDWTLEPIAFDMAEGGGQPTDVAYGMSVVAADRDGGFWALSGANWVHVDGDGRTAEKVTLPHGDPLIRVEAMAAVSPTEFAVVRGGPDPALSVLDITTMQKRDLRDPALPDDAFGDWAFADVAVHDGDAIAVRYVPQAAGYADYEVLRVNLEDGSRTPLYSAPLSLEDSPATAPAFPPVDVDVDPDGRIHVATPSTRVSLSADGSDAEVAEWTADHPRVAVAPDGSALWWGGGRADSAARSVIIGGSAEARSAIEQRYGCGEPIRPDALTFEDASGADHPLPFLCGANTAAWTGSAWVVAIGGEGGGVLVRLTPPRSMSVD